jgi:hypothetical protein
VHTRPTTAEVMLRCSPSTAARRSHPSPNGRRRLAAPATPSSRGCQRMRKERESGASSTIPRNRIASEDRDRR